MRSKPCSSGRPAERGILQLLTPGQHSTQAHTPHAAIAMLCKILALLQTSLSSVACCCPQDFSFTLTQGDGSRLHGFCRRFLPPAPRLGSRLRYPQVLCLMCEVSWAALFFKVRLTALLCQYLAPAEACWLSAQVWLCRCVTAGLFADIVILQQKTPCKEGTSYLLAFRAAACNDGQVACNHTCWCGMLGVEACQHSVLLQRIHGPATHAGAGGDRAAAATD
jgi:hypothetical protein